MSNENLATYLNDHVAGSVVAIELLERLEESHKETPLQSFFEEIRKDVIADRKELESLMHGLRVEISSTRRASAWLTEKFSALKLKFDDRTEGALHLLESVEVLSLGVAGKELLWQALATVSEVSVVLRSLDYERLIKRAEDQRNRLERVRQEAARQAVVPDL